MSPKQLSKLRGALSAALEAAPTRKQAARLVELNSPSITGQQGPEVKEAADIIAGKWNPAPVPVKTAEDIPPRLPRAKPRTKEEMEEIVHRVGPQLQKQFVRRQGKTESVADKSKKRHDRELEYQHDITAADQKALPALDIADRLGSVDVSLAGDASRLGTLRGIHGLQFNRPVELQAGPLFEEGWASGQDTSLNYWKMLDRIRKQYGDAPVNAVFSNMGSLGLNYAAHYSDALLEALNSAKIPKKNLDVFDKVMRNDFPEFVGVRNQDEAFLQMVLDPELRKHFAYLMELEGVSKGLGTPRGYDVKHAVEEPDLTTTEGGISGFVVKRPKLGLTHLPVETEHNTYGLTMPMETMGREPVLLPKEVQFHDTLDAIMKNPVQAKNPLGTLHFGVGRQIVDQQQVDQVKLYQELMKKYYGMRKGGLAEGGNLDDDDEIPNMPPNPTAEQRKEFERKLNRVLDRDYWKRRGKNSDDERIIDPENYKTYDENQIEVPPKFGVTSIPRITDMEEIDEKKQNRFYAVGGLATGGVPEKRDVSQLFPIRPELKGEPVARNRAGVPVQDTNVLGGALQGLGETLLGAGRGYTATALGGVQDLLNMVDIPQIMTGESYQIPYGSEYFKDVLPLKPTTQTGEVAQELGSFLPVDPTQVAKAGYKTAKSVGKAVAPTVAEMALDLAEKGGTPVRQFAVPPSDAKPGKVKAPADNLGFYSNVEKAALNLQRKTGTGDAFLADMMKNPGVSEARLEELGLTALRGKKNVTADEVRALAAKNKPKLTESIRAERNESVIEDLESEYEDLNRQLYDLQGSGNRGAIAEAEAALQENLMEQKRLKSIPEAKFSPSLAPEYNMPGGTNYREIRVNLPSREKPSYYISSKDGSIVSPGFATREAAERDLANIHENRPDFEIREEPAGRIDTEKTKDNFYHRAHHGTEPNVLFHLRVADHVDADGKKGLLIDELQSDWHQQGREKGYGPQYEDQYRAYYDTPKGQVDIGFGKTPEELERMVKASGWDTMPIEIKTEKTTSKVKEGVPDAPFKDNWYQLGLKRAIKEATDKGMDRVYLTTGKTQNERYSLSKHVDSLVLDKSNNGYLLTANKNGSPVISEQFTDPDKLESLIGKDASKKLLEKINAAENRGGVQTGKLAGVDLEIGGEGMKQYYDKNYLNWLKKYAKEHGAEVGMTKLGPDLRNVSDAQLNDIYTKIRGYKPIHDGERMTREEIIYELEGMEPSALGHEQVYYLDLNPKLKETAKKGQSYAEGGAVNIDDLVAQAFKNAPINLDDMVNEALTKKFAEGGAAYNTNPDMSDGGRYIQGEAF